jgi:hypothetical protein
MGFSGYTHLNVLVVRRETEKSFQVVLDNRKIYWLPKKCVQDAGDYKAGDRDCEMSIPDWLWEKIQDESNT